MKIYAKSVWLWQPDGPKLVPEECESFDYEGPVILCKGSPSPPPAPDYVGAAQAQGAGNLEAARATAKLSNPNIINPYGTQTVQYGLGGDQDIPTITQQLSPSGQQLFNQYQGINTGLGNVAQQGVGYVQNMLDKPFDQSKLPAAPVSPGQSYTDAAFARLQPNIDQQRAALNTQLSNQGIDAGSNSTAYANAQRVQNQAENDQRAAIVTSSIGQDEAARQAAIQEQSYFRNEPLNTLNAVRSAAPVGVPQFQGYQGAQTTAGPISNATAQAGQFQQGLYNAQVGQTNAANSNTATGLSTAAIVGTMLF